MKNIRLHGSPAPRICDLDATIVSGEAISPTCRCPISHTRYQIDGRYHTDGGSHRWCISDRCPISDRWWITLLQENADITLLQEKADIDITLLQQKAFSCLC